MAKMLCPNCGENVECNKKRYCHNKIPYSFAKKSGLNSTYSKLKGYTKRSEGDYLGYIKRFQKIKDMNIGEETVIEKIREDSFEGNEYRKVLNFSICRGVIIKKQIERKNDNNGEIKYYEVFKRINGKGCEFLKGKKNKEGIIIINCTLKSEEFN